MSASVEPGQHYDRVTAAWQLIFGPQLHYGVFDDVNDPLEVATDRLTNLMIETAAFHAPGTEVLDVGSGTGVIACRLGTELGARVLGITTSAIGVDIGRTNAAQLSISETVRFERRDGTDNELPDASFDVVWVLESSHLMRQRERLLFECARVLRPGGRVCLCDVMLRRNLAFTEVRALRKELALLRDVFGDAHMERLERYSDWLERQDVTVERVIDLSERTRPTFAAWRANIEAHRPRILELMGEPSVDAFHESTYVLERLWDDEIMGYGLIGGTHR
ncbi:MAG TPA: methyltransferase domain-containing protein [Mycobacteriales bacterium]|nr:methyltransferase domain-containing protein [Mycobacteriales bacterium]